MSLKKLSQHAASRGRNGDDQLVHMNKDEVQTLRGLAALGGTHMTTNPDTGLPEAFNLGGLFRKILPVVAGVAGTMVGGPAVGALASGAMTTATTGSLEKGLMAGMGSYALGGLGNAALGQGAQNLATPAAEAATQAGTQAAQQGMSTGIGEAAQQAMATQAGPGIGMAESLQSQFPSLTPDQITQVTAEGTPELMAQRASMLNTFGQNTPTGQMGGTFQPTAMDKLGALNTNDIMKIGMENPAGVIGAGMGAMNLLTPEPETPGTGGPMIGAGLDPDYFRRLGQQQARGFAGGGLVSLARRK